MMDKWQKWLNSLATRGGAIFILVLLTVAADGGAFTMYHLMHDLDARGLAYFVASGGMLNALMLALKNDFRIPDLEF